MGNNGETLRIPGFWKLLGVIIANIFPGVSLITLTKGIKRLFTNDISFHYYTLENVYQTDRRFRTGKKVIGQTKKEHITTKPKAQCSNDEIRYFRIHALIYISIAILAIGLKAYCIQLWAEEIKEDSARKIELKQKVTHWNTYQIKDDFTGNVREFKYVYPTTLFTDLVMVKEKGFFLYSSMYISSFDKMEFKIFNKSRTSIYSKELSYDYLDDKEKLSIELDKTYTYRTRYTLTGTLSNSIASADSMHLRISDTIYKFNNLHR